MKNLEKSLLLVAAIGIFSGCPDSKEVTTQASQTRDAVSATLCRQHAYNDAERCHARGLAGPKECWGRVLEATFRDCMKQN